VAAHHLTDRGEVRRAALRGDLAVAIGFERLAEDVARRATPAFAAVSVIPQHCRVLLAMPPLALCLSLEATP
jgi:hypothetical protein